MAFPLSAGSIMRFSLLRRSLRACLSWEDKLDGAGLAFLRILVVSCLINSASSGLRWLIVLSIWDNMCSVGITFGVRKILKSKQPSKF